MISALGLPLSRTCTWSSTGYSQPIHIGKHNWSGNSRVHRMLQVGSRHHAASRRIANAPIAINVYRIRRSSPANRMVYWRPSCTAAS